MSALIGALRVDLSLNSAAFEKGIAETQRRLKSFQRRASRIAGDLQSVGRGLSLGITAPVVAFGALALRAGGDFEAGMNRVAAVSGASKVEIAALRDAAKEMGATTQYSATQAAEALGFLSMAGFDANEAAASLPGTLQLASAAQMDLAQSADIVSNVLSGYGFEVGELSRVNDVLVKTFTSANTDLVQLGEAMKYAGPIASAAGVAFEESAAAIGLMGNAGIQASMAGTSLRGAIGRMLEPTGAAAAQMKALGLSFTDAAGKLIPLDEVITQLEPHADNAGLFLELFGQRAGPAMAALVSQGSAALVELRGELEGAGGTAAAISATQMEGFKGAILRLKSAFEAVQIAVAESGLLEFATGLADKMSGWLSSLAALDPAILRFATVAAGAAAAVGPLLLVVGGAVAAFSILAPMALAALAPLSTLAAAGAAVALAWGPLSAAVEFASNHLLILSPFIGALTLSIGSALVPAISAAIAGFTGLAAAGGVRLVSALAMATAGFKTLRAAMISTGIGALVVGLGMLAAEFVELVDRAGSFRAALVVLQGIASEVAGRMETAWDGVKAKLSAVWLGVKAAALSSLSVVLSAVSGFVNRYIGLYVGAYEAVKAAWGALPGAFANIGARAMNALIDIVQARLGRLVGAINYVLGAVKLPEIKPPDLSGLRVEVAETEGVVASASAAFAAAFSHDYVGPVADGFSELAAEASAAGDAASAAGDALLSSVGEPLQTLEALAEAERMVASGAVEVGAGADEAGDAVAGATGEVEALGDALDAAGGSGRGMGADIAAGADTASDALARAAERAQSAQSALSGSIGNFASDLVDGDAGEAFSNLFDGFVGAVGDSLGSLVSDAFAVDGGGFGEIITGFTASIEGVSTALTSLATGGGITALFGAVSSALPIIGAGLAVFNLIRTFSSKELISSGLQFDVSGGLVDGSSFETYDVSYFWGLIHKEKTEYEGLDAEVLAEFQGQVDLVQKGVAGAFGALGISVADSFLDAVEFASEKIDTAGMSDDEAAEVVAAAFEAYGEALSMAVGQIGLDALETLAVVQNALIPLGMEFELVSGAVSAASDGFDLRKFAEAAEALADLFGGVEEFANGVGSFFDAFFTDAEKLVVMNEKVSDTFAALGLAVPETDAAFKELVMSQDLLSEAGAEAFAALVQIAPVFDAITDAAAAQAEALLAVYVDRAGALFDLLPDAEQIEWIKAEVEGVFAALGSAVPKSIDELSSYLAALDLSTDAGLDAWAAVSELVPELQRVFKYEADLAAAELAASEALLATYVDRAGVLFDLLPDAEQIEWIKAEVDSVFASLGSAVPKSIDELSSYLAAIDLSTDAGLDAWAAVSELVPELQRVFKYEADAAAAELAAAADLAAAELAASEAFLSAVKEMRGDYSFDAAGYANSWEAKLADELANSDRYSQDVISAQNAILNRQSALLEAIRDEVARGNRASEDAVTVGGFI